MSQEIDSRGDFTELHRQTRWHRVWEPSATSFGQRWNFEVIFGGQVSCGQRKLGLKVYHFQLFLLWFWIFLGTSSDLGKSRSNLVWKLGGSVFLAFFSAFVKLCSTSFRNLVALVLVWADSVLDFLPMSFREFNHSLSWSCSKLVHKDSRSIVTTWSWQVRVDLVGIDFGI
jgi:hypothetical protein